MKKVIKKSLIILLVIFNLSNISLANSELTKSTLEPRIITEANISEDKPIISGKNRIFRIGMKIDLRKYAKAFDINDGDISNNLTIEGSIPNKNGIANETGIYKIKYKVKNSKNIFQEKAIEIKILPANKSLLKINIEKASRLNKEKYDENLGKDLQKVIDEAINIKNNDNSTPKEINEIIKKLNQVSSKLVSSVENGTEKNPYLISDRKSLEKLKENSNPDNFYKIISDIDLGDKEWIPFDFVGNIDGKNHKIINLKINNIYNPEVNSETDVGLFKSFGNEKNEIKNLILENVQISNTKENPSKRGVLKTGAIAGELKGKVKNIIVNGSIYGGVAGGIAGYSYSDIIKSGFIGEVVGEASTGGLIGYSDKSNLKESFAKGYIKSEKSYAGGLAGSIDSIENSYASCMIDGKNIAGLAGTAGTRIRNSYSSSILLGDKNNKLGLFVNSSNYYTDVTNSYYDKELVSLKKSDRKSERTTQQMKEGIQSKDIYNNWKLDIWEIKANNYPKLKWEKENSAIRKIKNLVILNSPNKTKYYIGEEIDITGLKVLGIYDNGDIETLNITKENILGFDNTKEYEKLEVKIIVDNVETSMTLEVRSKDMGLNGEGSKENPYKINNSEELKKINKFFSTKDMYFEIENDLDLQGVEWKAFAFDGYLDGKNHTISNLNYEDNAELVGFFTVIGKENKESEVKNIKFENSKIVNLNTKEFGYYNDTRNHTGTLAGESYGKISNVHVNGVVENKKEHIGGIIGDNKGIIEKSSFIGEIKESYKNTIEMGGIASRNFGEIKESFTEGKIIRGTDIIPLSRVGGIVGHLEKDAILKNCYSTMKMSARQSIGGITGTADKTSTIENCYFAGNITFGADYQSARGGIYSGYQTPKIINSYYDKDIIGFSDESDLEYRKSTEEMKSGVPFENWDDQIWTFEKGNYPKLKLN